MVVFQDETLGDPTIIDMTNEERDDIAAFLRMWDRGISRGVHQAFWVDATTDAEIEDTIECALLEQARAGWCDVIAMGEFPVQSVPEPVVWRFDPTLGTSGEFVPDHAQLSNVELGDFFGLPTARNSIIGVPQGMGRYLGGDFDYDGVPAAQEIVDNTDPFEPDPYSATPDCSAITLRHLYSTMRVGVYVLTSPEPVRYDAAWWPDSAGPDSSLRRDYSEPNYARVHTVVLRGMHPPTLWDNVADPVIDHQPHTVEITVTDLQQQTCPTPITPSEPLFPALGEEILVFGKPQSAIISKLTDYSDPPVPGEANVELELQLTWEQGQSFAPFSTFGITSIPLGQYIVIGQV